MMTGEILCPGSSKYIEWKFGNFSSYFKEEYCNIQSPFFPFVGAWWNLTVFPCAQEGYSGWIKVYLSIKDACNPEIRVSGRIGMKRGDGSLHVSHPFDQHSFNAENTYKGFLNFLQRSSLLSGAPQIFPRDEVTFCCWLCLIDEQYREVGCQTSEFQDIYKLSQDFKNLYLNGKDSDTTIKIGDREFQAHRLILGARSPVFASMYSHDTTEKSTGIVEIEDCDPEVFQVFLLFLYSGKLEAISSETALGLYAVADKYDVQEVKQKCLKFMLSNLSVDNICDITVLALRYSESELLKSTSDFFVENVRKICVTPQWLCFHRDYPVESNELCIKAFQVYVPD